MRKLCLCLALSLTGCAGSLNPLYEKNEDLLDPKAYLGVWSDNGRYAVRTTKVEKPSQERLVLLELLEDPRVGRIPPQQPTPPGNGAVLIAGLVKVDEHVFLDLTLTPEMLNVFAPDFAPTARMHLVQTHSFSKVRLRDNELVLETLSLKKLGALLAKNPKLVAHKRIHQRKDSELALMAPSWKPGDVRQSMESGLATGSPSLLFTAEPAELRAFLGKHATADIWEKPTIFTRGQEEEFDSRWKKFLERLKDAEKRRDKDAIPLRFSAVVARADDAGIAKLLKAKGAEVAETKGAVTAVTVGDGSKWTDEDFRQLAGLAHLKILSFSGGLNDERLALLASLPELEYLQTNLAEVTDEGIKPLARMKNLKNLKFFHPGKAFSGAGLVHLASLPNLQSLTVAGSFAFNDDGMAAVSKLTQLGEFRTWHVGGTNKGVKHLKALKNLKSLYLGQRLTYRAPACPDDETVGILAELASLESLQLEEARLTFASLQQLKKLPNLKRLKLGGIDIAKDDVGRLQKALPQVTVVWTEPNKTYHKRIQALFGQ